MSPARVLVGGGVHVLQPQSLPVGQSGLLLWDQVLGDLVLLLQTAAPTVAAGLLVVCELTVSGVRDLMQRGFRLRYCRVSTEKIFKTLLELC